MSRKKAGEKSWESFPRPFSWQRAGGREERSTLEAREEEEGSDVTVTTGAEEVGG